MIHASSCSKVLDIEQMDSTKKKNLCKRSITQKCKQFSKTHFQRETERIPTPKLHSTRDKKNDTTRRRRRRRSSLQEHLEESRKSLKKYLLKECF
jgi:hypothetical protein